MNDKVGNILLSRMMGADSRLDPHGFDIGIRDSWKDALREVEESGGTPYAIPAGASRAPARRPRVRQLGVRGRRAGEGARRHLRHDRRLHRHRLDPRRDDRRLRRARGPHRRPPPGARHRRLAPPSTRPATRSSASPGTPPSSSSSAATCATTRSPCSRAGPATSTASPSTRRWRRCALGAAARGDDHRPGLRGEVARRPDRPRRAAATSRGTRHVLYAHLGGQPAINAYHSLWPAS